MVFRLGCLTCLYIAISAFCTTARAGAQNSSQTAPAALQNLPQQAIGRIDIAATAEQIRVAGAVTLSGDSTLLGNGSTITAGSKTLPIHLTRGGQLDLCATTQLHLSQQNSTSDPNSPLMLALDHGAMEARYTIGKNSDVVLTPDLRILLSGPGKADVRIRVSEQGDTCVDNLGKNAPYVTVSEQIGTGVYRVQANQRVLFEHGSVRDVVDHEAQPCGCPAPTISTISVANAGKSATAHQPVAKPGETVSSITSLLDNPHTMPADTAFPLAESEGLVAPPTIPPASKSIPGETQSQVTTTLSYIAPKQAVPTGAPNGMATPESAATVATTPAPGFGPIVNTGPVEVAQIGPPVKPHRRGFFRKIGHFFSRIFG